MTPTSLPPEQHDTPAPDSDDESTAAAITLAERIVTIETRTAHLVGQVVKLDGKITAVERSLRSFEERTGAVLSSISSRIGAAERTLGEHAARLAARGIAIGAGVAVADLLWKFFSSHYGLQ